VNNFAASIERTLLGSGAVFDPCQGALPKTPVIGLLHNVYLSPKITQFLHNFWIILCHIICGEIM